MAFTQSDIDAIDRAIASGELTVRHGDRLTTYRSVQELLAARDAMQAELAQQAGSRLSPRYRVAVFKGQS